MAEVSSSSSSSRRNRFKVKRVEAAVGQSDAEGDDNYESDKEVKHFDCFNLRTHRDLDDCGEIEIVCIVLTILVNLSIVDDVHRNNGPESIEMGERQANESDRAASPTALLTTHNTNTYTTVNESTKYAKSLRHFTREALPRLDNYRNILSIQAGHRPTLEELHNATIHDKVRLFIQPQKNLVKRARRILQIFFHSVVPAGCDFAAFAET
jgi:hypothetical protein